jgi:hypothetical protein
MKSVDNGRTTFKKNRFFNNLCKRNHWSETYLKLVTDVLKEVRISFLMQFFAPEEDEIKLKFVAINTDCSCFFFFFLY